ncbi:MAG: hypothetical protein JNK30_09475 [Phenylobacterium sp.]|uniref:hypothetical protein n=1 Tax=Phenylobacterium sp. TaxID=1871053 RepID=UPI001A4EC45B|nr:hypothetical protein [Phenylobacterium sp.]MBL8771598.1 hypothetical protein [Phenylobacterium sp.]
MRWVLAAAFGLSLAGVAATASAQPKGEARAAIVQKLVDCRKIADGAARLACYDDTAAALDQAEAKGDIVVVDRDQARKVRRQAFGFSLPSISLFEKGETQEELENVSGVVQAARQNGMGQWIIKLEDGAVWAQIDSNEVSRTPKPGMPVKIRRASLGSFLMTVGNQRAFRARRTE